MLLLKRKIDVNGVPMTTQTPLFSGSIVALVTPMDNHGNIDFETLEKLIEFHINAGTDSIVSVGTTGESATLSIEENVKVVEKTVELAKGRIPIIAGTGANATSEAIVMTKLLRDSGVASCLHGLRMVEKLPKSMLYLTTINLLKKACSNILKRLQNVRTYHNFFIMYLVVLVVI